MKIFSNSMTSYGMFISNNYRNRSLVNYSIRYLTYLNTNKKSFLHFNHKLMSLNNFNFCISIHPESQFNKEIIKKSESENFNSINAEKEFNNKKQIRKRSKDFLF